MNDKKENESEANKIVGKDRKTDKCYWKDIRVGDVIKVYEDEVDPAHMILLQSSGQKGQCFVETKSLDGETNLKIKST